MKNPYAKPRVRKESVLEKQLVARVKKYGGEIRKIAFLGRKGAPDRLVMFPGGVMTWIETKSETGKLRPEQKREIDRLVALGQSVKVIRSEWESEFVIGELYDRSILSRDK